MSQEHSTQAGPVLHRTGRRLRLLFHSLALVFLLGSAAGVTWFTRDHLAQLREQRLAETRMQLERQATRIDEHMQKISDHVQRMRALAERALADPELPRAPELRPVERDGRLLGYSWDHLGGTYRGPIGNAFYTGEADPARRQRELDMIAAVFPYVAGEHGINNALHWSHYTSFQHPAGVFYPFIGIDALLAVGGTGDLDGYFRQAISPQDHAGLMQRASGGRIGWTRFYEDQAGAGAVLSAFALVHDGGEAIGVVGCDVKLSTFLLEFLNAGLPREWELRLLGTGGGHVSSRGDIALGGTEATPATQGWHEEAGVLEARVALARAPFGLQLRIPSASLLAPVDTLRAGLQILAFMMLGLFVAGWVLVTRFFVDPSLLLGDVVSEDRPLRFPAFPRLWHGVLRRLDAMREERAQLHASLREERDLLERRVAERTTELERLNRELKSFNHAVSHDLRAPLRSIAGFAEALHDEHAARLDTGGLDLLERIARNARATSRMIEALTRLSRLEAQALERQEVDISTLCAQVIETLRGADPGREVEVGIEAGLRAFADPTLTRNVLENLLGNAWKFSSRTPQARIRVYAEERAQGRFICIEDNGAGFDDDDAERLFAPFQRGHSEEAFAGSGIGLSTVKRIVERHGGTISARGRRGHGACFAFCLPDPGASPAAPGSTLSG